MDSIIVPVPVICEGIINKLPDEDVESFIVNIIHSPKGFINGIYCPASFAPGLMDSYKLNDVVKILVYFNFNTGTGDYEDVVFNADHTIIGLSKLKKLTDYTIKNPLLDIKNSIKFICEKSNSGSVILEDGTIVTATNGYSYNVKRPEGDGIEENIDRTHAQNHHKILSGFDNISKEHFGIYTGIDDEDKAFRALPSDKYITYRRFVQQTLELDNWVSTCEGTWSPYIGPNNDSTSIKKSRDVIFTKIINKDNNRVTIECGEEGEGFFTFRVDKVILNEKYIPSGGSSPPIAGNVFSCRISEDGESVIEAGNKGLPKGNIGSVKIKISKDGEIEVNAQKKITFTNGDNDKELNSIVLDKAEGIDLKSSKGLKFNGKHLVTSDFIDFMRTHQADLILTVAPGSPAPMGPAAIADFTTGSLPGQFTTNPIGVPATGIITSETPILKSTG